MTPNSRPSLGTLSPDRLPLHPLDPLQNRAHPIALSAVLVFLLLPFGATFPASAAGAGRAGLERALTAQLALVAATPGDASLQEDLGHLLAIAGDLEGAESAYRQAALLDVSAASPHFHLGTLLEREGKSRAALKEYKAAIELDSKHAWALYEAGSIYDQWGIESRALHYYGTALRFDPTLADPTINPHILENRLATRAMMYGYQKSSHDLPAPRQFHEPARIAALMIDIPTATPADELADTGSSGGFARLSGAEESPRSADTQSGVSANNDGEATRVLSSRDLDSSGASNQVSGGASSTIVGRGSRDSASAARERAKARETSRPASTRATAPRSGSGSSIGPARPRSDGGSDPSGGFVPNAFSTGRVEVVLEPVIEG